MFRALRVPAILLALLPVSMALAASRPEAPTTPPTTHTTTPMEIVVLEAPGCLYCPVFRTDVAPTYAATPRATRVPLRFLDLNDPAADQLALTEPVTMVPTTVILSGGKEIGRITGVVAAESFLSAVSHLLLGHD